MFYRKPILRTAVAAFLVAMAPAAMQAFGQAQEDTERLTLAQNDAAITSERFQLGTHYDRLAPVQPTGSGPGQIEVAEIFWYGCAYCYTFDPYLESWKQDLPPGVSFVRIPVLWGALHQLHARAYYTAETLGIVDEIHTPIFREMHVNGNPLNNEQALQRFFEDFGVDAEAFAAAFNSFAVHTRLQRADELARRYRISSVPTVIVNGKYSASASSAGDYRTLMELIDELVASERAGE